MRRIQYPAGLIVKVNLWPKITRQPLAVYGHKQRPFTNSHPRGNGETRCISARFSRSLHQISSDIPQISWEEKLDDYRSMLGRCWRKASDIKRDEEIKDISTLEEMSMLEREFENITKGLLNDLELLPPILDVKKDDKKFKGALPPIMLPRINVGDVFNVLSGSAGLRPMDVNLHEFMLLLDSKFGPYKVVKKLVNRTLSLSSTKPDWLFIDPSEASFSIYRVLTAYLFYTSLTPQDIRGILSTPSVIDGLSAIDDALIKEYFSFLLLYLEMCEADDDLRQKYPTTKKGLKEALIIQEDSEDFFGRQSRRVLMGRLKDCLFLYNLNGGFSPEKPVTHLSGLTGEQKEIVELDLNIGEVLKIKAFAGTGKTTVLTEYAKARPEEKWLFLTFNNSVQKDAEKKFGPNVVCRTIHSLTRKTVLRMRPKIKAPTSSENNLVREIVQILDLENKETLKTAMLDPSKKLPRASKVAKVINENLLTFFTSAEVGIDYASLHWMMADKLGLKKDVVLELTRRAWDELQKLQGPCFPHDGYLKMMHLDGVDSEKEGVRCRADDLAFGQFDGIMFDEAQDADSVMAEIIFRQRPFSRTIVVGDPNQMIYEFRGTNNECFDDSLYPATYNKSLTYSFRFGLGIAAAAAHYLRAIGEPLTMKAIGDVDVLKTDFPKVMEEEVDPAIGHTTIYNLPPGLSSDGGSGKHVVICRKNSSLVSALFSYCHSHPEHRVYLKVPTHMQPRTLFSYLKSAYELKQGIPAIAGPLRGLRSIEALMGKVGSESPINTGASKKCKLLLEEAEEELKAIDPKIRSLLEVMTRKYKLKRQDQRQIQQLLKGSLTPNMENFLQALVSRDLAPRMFPPELKLVAGLERQDLLSDPSFLGKIDFCTARIVDDAENADMILCTAHQAKGLEWDNVVMADDFAALHIHRHSSGVGSSNLESVRIMYVASTRARKELHMGQKTAAPAVSASGSYGFFLSPKNEVCPKSHDGVRGKSSEETTDNPANTCGQLIGYRTVMPTARFGSNLVIRKTGNFPFGDREDVIGCHKCVVDLYKPALRRLADSYAQSEYETITELERLVDILKQALDGDSSTESVIEREPMSQRGGWLRKFEDMNTADEIRVGSWMRKNTIFSWGVWPQQARMRRSN